MCIDMNVVPGTHTSAQAVRGQLVQQVQSVQTIPAPALHVQKADDPLTASMLAEVPPQEQKQMLGERLFPLIHNMHPELAGKITGMLLEIDISELLYMLESRESLKAKVEEAVAVLHAHQAKARVIQNQRMWGSRRGGCPPEVNGWGVAFKRFNLQKRCIAPANICSQFSQFR